MTQDAKHTALYNLPDEVMKKIFGMVDIGEVLKTTGTHLDIKKNFDFAKFCAELKQLDLSKYPSITDEEFIKLIENCPNLESINLSSCIQLTDTAFMGILDRCKELESINLSGCRQLTDRAFTKLAECCKELKSINLSSCIQLTDTAFMGILDECKKVTSVNLANCPGLTMPFLSEIPLYYTNLEHINLSFNPQFVKIDTIENQQDTKLQHINFTQCYLKGAELVKLTEHCPELKSINLSQCPNIDDDTIRAVARQCKNLEHFHFFGGHGLNKETLLYLLNQCQSLKSVTGLTLKEETLNELNSRYPNCEFLPDSPKPILHGLYRVNAALPAREM